MAARAKHAGSAATIHVLYTLLGPLGSALKFAWSLALLTCQTNRNEGLLFRERDMFNQDVSGCFYIILYLTYRGSRDFSRRHDL